MPLSQQQIDSYRAAIAKTHQWAHQNWNRFVEEKDPQAHYKALAFWASVGDTRMAAVHRRLIEESFLQADGDFRMSPTERGWKQFPSSPKNRYLYANGWIVAGLMRSGAYDLARRALEFILLFQDSASGGFFSRFDPATQTIDRSVLDSSSTSSAGIALVASGRLAEARRAGDFILRLLDLQPKPKEFFYASIKDGKLETDLGDSQDQWDNDGRKQKCLSAVNDAASEMTWLIGKPNKFLARLYSATGEHRYLDGARRTVDFFLQLPEAAWTNFASCKTMWAAAEMYRLTGEQRYFDITTRLMDYYCQTQSPSGTWVHTLWYKQESDQPFGWTADITLEYGVEFSDVLYDLSGR